MIYDKREIQEKTFTKNDISGLILASLFWKIYDFFSYFSFKQKISLFIHK